MIREAISCYRIMRRVLNAASGEAVMKMLAVLLLCECLAGCGSSSATNLTANWHFIFTSSANGDTYTGTASLTQSSAPVTSQGAGGLERMLSGTINFTNDPCATTAPISGTISGSNVILTATESGQPVSLTGNVNAAFTAMSGDYTAPGGGCTAGDFGSWTASRS
jgi:hypothetical protein